MTSSAGVSLLSFTYTASAVNYVGVINNTIGSSPAIFATGTDTNIILQLSGKGTGGATVQGTSTNNNATAGFVGEYISSNVAIGAGPSVTSNTATDITSISLTAGDWDVFGSFITDAAGGTTTTLVVGWMSTTSATLPTAPNNGSYAQLQGLTLAAGSDFGASVGTIRVSVNTTTTVYLSTFITFAISTMKAAGFIGARRVR